MCNDDLAFVPVCGSDQTTYPNRCAMERNSCLMMKTITAVKEEPCGKQNHLSCVKDLVLQIQMILSLASAFYSYLDFFLVSKRFLFGTETRNLRNDEVDAILVFFEPMIVRTNVFSKVTVL